MTEPTRPATRRYDGLDALRAGAMLLGLLFHATWAYVPGIARWYLVEDSSTATWAAPLAQTLHAFRMQTFFALSGFFAHLVMERHGADGFLRDRARRLGAPLVVATPMLVLFDWALRQWSAARGLLSPTYPGGTDWLLRPLHLWFLEYLLLFVAAAWALTRCGLHVAPLVRLLRLGLRRPELLLVLSLLTALARLLLGEPTPAFGFAPEAASVAHFAPFFLLGWLLWSARDAAPALARWSGLRAALGLCLAGWVYSRAVQWEPAGFFLGALATWLLVLGLLGLGFCLPPRPRPWLRALVESSYWVYLAHYPLVVAGQVLLARAPWPAALKFALVVAAAGAVSFSTFFALVRRSALGPWLGVKAG